MVITPTNCIKTSHTIIRRFTRVGGTCFQAHTRIALKNVLRNFLTTLLFAENVEEHGSGKNSLVTKETYAKVIGLHKKWLKVEFIVVTNLLLKVLDETSHLCYLFESDSALIYQLCDAVKDGMENLIDIKNDDVGDMSDLLPQNIKVMKKTVDNANFLNANTITIQVEATNIPPCQLRKIHNTSQEDQMEVEKKLVKIKETFKFNSVSQGKKKMASVKTSLLSNTVSLVL